MTRLVFALFSLLTVLTAGFAIPASNHYLDHDFSLSSFQEVKHHHHHHHHHGCHNASTSAASTQPATETSITETLSTSSATETQSTTEVTTGSSEPTSSANATSTLVTSSSTLSSSTESSSATSSSVSTIETSSTVTSTSASSTQTSVTKTSTSSASGPTGTGTSSTDINAYLIAHNSVRAHHGAADLKWNETLAAAAQKWVAGCQLKHSNGTVGPFGENLAAGAGGGYNITSAVQSWTAESSSFDSSNPEPSHFTQVVWKATTQVGCASTLCDGMFPPEYGKALFVACEYFTPGNVAGEYADNVQA